MPSPDTDAMERFQGQSPAATGPTPFEIKIRASLEAHSHGNFYLFDRLEFLRYKFFSYWSENHDWKNRV
jgi:hypothetical protein